MMIDLNQMKTDLRSDFEAILDFVTGEQARTATAYQIEHGLFKFLLSLGAKLLVLFFQMRSQACARTTCLTKEGQTLPYHGEQKRTYFSIFGLIPLWRPYFYQASVGGQAPLDAELSLGADRYADLLRELLTYVGVYVPYSKAVAIWQRFLQGVISTRALQAMVAGDAAEVEAYYAQKPAPAAIPEATILVIQADGKGVPMVLDEPAPSLVRLGKGQKRGHKKEAIVTTVYTIAPHPRTPQQVVTSFFHQNEAAGGLETSSSPPKPQHKHLWATLAGKDAALLRLTTQVKGRLGPHIQSKVALTDGCEALQDRVETYFPDFKLVLDFIHANEYLWEVATSLFGETDDQRPAWVAQQTLLMLSGQTQQIITDFRSLAQAADRTKTQREKLTKTANYFERNLPYMDYPTYLAQGWPIASGVIEGACRHFVKDRFELSGMRWTQAGAEHLLHLRAVAENGDWEAYHHFRRRRRHEQLYTLPFPEQGPFEFQALEPNSPPKAHPSQSGLRPTPIVPALTCPTSPVTTTPTSENVSTYYALEFIHDKNQIRR
jgi:hypothetical protein